MPLRARDEAIKNAQDGSRKGEGKSISDFETALPNMSVASALVAAYNEPLRDNYVHHDDATTVSMMSMSVQTSATFKDSLPILTRNQILAHLEDLAQHCESSNISSPEDKEFVRTITSQIEEETTELCCHIERLMYLNKRSERNVKIWQKKATKSAEAREKLKMKMKERWVDMEMDLQQAQQKLAESEEYKMKLKKKLARREEENARLAELLRGNGRYSASSCESEENSDFKGSRFSLRSLLTRDTSSVESFLTCNEKRAIDESNEVQAENIETQNDKINKMIRNLSLGERSLKKIMKRASLDSPRKKVNVNSDCMSTTTENQNNTNCGTDLVSSISEINRDSHLSSEEKTTTRESWRKSGSLDPNESCIGLPIDEHFSSRNDTGRKVQPSDPPSVYDESFHMLPKTKKKPHFSPSWMDNGLKQIFGGKICSLRDETLPKKA